MSFTPVDQKTPVKAFTEPLDGLCYAWCPTMDLLAVSAAQGKRVLVFRMNGVQVWDIAVGQGIAKSTVWRPDGRQLAITTTKQQTLVYDTNTARLLATLQARGSDFSFGHWIVSDSPRLENRLAGILLEQDITKSMPKLPPLPSTNTEHTFATRQAIDGLIQQEKHGMMDLLFLFGDKTVTITLHGLFLLGAVEIVPQDDDADIVNAVTRTVEDHYFLTTSYSTMTHTLRRFTTHFVESYDFLQDITLSSSKIIALLGYIEEILTFSTQAIKAYTEFNAKFVGILKDELNDRNEIAVDELYNLLLTGMMNKEVKDWIQNTVGDRGVKRWTKIGETAFDNTRRTILYHLVPACERLIVLLSNLDAITKSSNAVKDKFEVNFVKNSIDSVKRLLKLLYEDVFKINREQELFNSFIVWIKTILAELQDEKPKEGYVTSEVSTFINGHLERSVLMMVVPFLRRNYNQIKIDTHDMFESIKSQIRSSIELDQDFQLTLGQICEKQEMKFIEDDLYTVTYHSQTVNFYKIDINTKSLQTVTIQFDHEITEAQLTEDGDVYLVANGSILRFSYQTLFQPDVISRELSQRELELVKDCQLPGLEQTKHLAINGPRNIGCAISQDLLKYSVFFLNDEPDL